MKGQQQVVSAVLLVGILATIVGSVYLWGIPLIEKNKAVNSLHNTEDFMQRLNEKIKFIANNGGQDSVVFNVPGEITFSPNKHKIHVLVRTKGSIYSTGGKVPLTRNITNHTGRWGKTPPESLYVITNKTGQDNYLSVFTLFYRKLSGKNDIYYINLTGPSASAGQDHDVVVENMGSERQGNIISTNIEIRIL